MKLYGFGCAICCAALSLTAAEPGATAPEAAKTVDLPQQETDSVIASVNGYPVSLLDILPESRAREQQLRASLTGKRLEEAILAERRRILDQLIERKLMVAEYRKAPFKIPEQYLESMLDDRAALAGVRSRSDFAALLREAGIPMSKMRERAEEELIVQVMLSRNDQIRPPVTPREVHDYFEANKAEFGTPEQWQLAMIRVAPDIPDRANVLAEIDEVLKAKPERFADMAGKYSSGANAAQGGDLGLLDRVRIRPEFAAAFGDQPEIGSICRTSADGADYYLRLMAITPGKEPVYRDCEAKIREKLEAAARKQALEDYIARLRAQAIIRYFF